MQSILKTRIGCALLVIALASSTLPLSAQAIYGSIYGQVTDQSGAAVPNATITVSDESKGTSVQATSNQSGEYTVPNLIPDVYDVKAEAPGFRAVENNGVQVSADTSPKVDLKLSVGNATESVTVTTEAPQLQTDRADVGTVFNQKNDFRTAHRGAQLCQPSTLDSGSPGDGVDAEQRRGRSGQSDRANRGAVLLWSWVSARRRIEPRPDFGADRDQPAPGLHW